MAINDKYEFEVWPGQERRMPSVTVDMIHPDTGEIVKTRRFSYRKSKDWWKDRGFSFNGRVNIQFGSRCNRA